MKDDLDMPDTMSTESITRLLGEILEENADLTGVTKELNARERENDESYAIEWAHGIMRWLKLKLKEIHGGPRDWEYRAYRESRRNRLLSTADLKRMLNLSSSETQIEEAILSVSNDAKRILKDRVRAELNTDDPDRIRKEMELIGQLARKELPKRSVADREDSVRPTRINLDPKPMASSLPPRNG